MGRGLKRLTGRFGLAIAVAALVTMLLPDPATRLCIAPGNHIAIEEMDSDCCGSHCKSFTAEKDCRDRLETTGDCRGCTDLPIVSFGPETIETAKNATGVPAIEDPDRPAAAVPAVPFSERDGNLYQASCRADSSLPMLC